jgi:hypothetical protein
MHMLLYLIAGLCVLIGAGTAWVEEDIMFLGNALLATVLFGALAKLVHLLDQIEEHLRSGATAAMFSGRRPAKAEPARAEAAPSSARPLILPLALSQR